MRHGSLTLIHKGALQLTPHNIMIVSEREELAAEVTPASPKVSIPHTTCTAEPRTRVAFRASTIELCFTRLLQTTCNARITMVSLFVTPSDSL